jgi:hypothetical protein
MVRTAKFHSAAQLEHGDAEEDRCRSMPVAESETCVSGRHSIAFVRIVADLQEARDQFASQFVRIS